MADTDNITFEKTLNGATVKVTMDTTRMDKDFVKALEMNTIPKSTDAQTKTTTASNFGPNPTRVMDLLQLQIRYDVEGTISQGAQAGDTHADVDDRKNDLENMNLAGGVLTFNYDNETGVTGNIEKLKITKVFTDGTTTFNTNEVGYKIKMTIIKGVNM